MGAGQADRNQSRLATDVNAIVDAIAIKIAPQRFGAGGRRSDKRENTTERDGRASPYVCRSCAEQGVVFQGR